MINYKPESSIKNNFFSSYWDVFAASTFLRKRDTSEKNMVSVMELLKEVEGEKRPDEPLHRYTSFNVGGKADVLFFPENEASLIEAVRIARENNIPVLIIGNGSNMLIRDGGIHGIVICLKKIKTELEVKPTGQETFMLTSSSGIPMPKLVRYSIEEGLEGIETLIGIPGTLGGALKMNAGAEGKEIGDVVHSVKMLNFKGEVKMIMKNEIRFNYRKTKFPEEGVFLNAGLELKKGDKDALLKKVKLIMQKRNATQPVSQRGAGSIFKNPEGHYAGKLIESTGLKGFSVGDAEISPKHANFIINKGEAKAKDIEDLISIVQEKVMLKTGISLKTEIEIIGEP